jgi:hypothetical protein
MVRGIVFEESAAREVERRLRMDGYAVTVTRERFAGEDDDEAHPWAIDTDAPTTALDLLLDAHDGWLDDSPADATSADVPPVEPLELPDAPRRQHRE